MVHKRCMHACACDNECSTIGASSAWMCVHACLRACACMRVGACAWVRVRACACVCMRVHACACVCMWVHVQVRIMGILMVHGRVRVGHGAQACNRCIQCVARCNRCIQCAVTDRCTVMMHADPNSPVSLLSRAVHMCMQTVHPVRSVTPCDPLLSGSI